MDSPQKFSSSKEVIEFLAQTFPQCFSTEGDAKPLKIGIFQDLTERLSEESRLSKTLLRSSLRHYTNSWRYLYSVKEGAFRVDLDGKQDAPIEKDHADHAKQQLDESRRKVAEQRKAKTSNKTAAASAEDKGQGKEKKFNKSRPKPKPRATLKGKQSSEHKSPKVMPKRLTEADLKAGTAVSVKVGKVPMKAVITDVGKDGVSVQLDSGMVVKVKEDNLRLPRTRNE